MAIAMQRRLQELQHEWREAGQERPFQVRMAINTGYCTVGNFGSADRMDYTIIGNEVNLASRLQAHAEPGKNLHHPRDLFAGQEHRTGRGAGACSGQGLFDEGFPATSSPRITAHKSASHLSRSLKL